MTNRRWTYLCIALGLLVVYFWATRTTTRVVGTVDASGTGMTVNGV